MIGLEQYLEALAEEEAPVVVAVGPSRRKPVGPRRAVPHREKAVGVEHLSVDHQALMAAALDAGADATLTVEPLGEGGWFTARSRACMSMGLSDPRLHFP
ncbi:hypothetical protein ACWDCB_36460 [Streptomyces sp. NPDC001178]